MLYEVITVWPSPSFDRSCTGGPSHQGQPVIGCPLFGGDCHVDRHVLAAKLAIMEAHAAVGQREQGVILAHADVGARVHLGPALTDDDVAADHFLTAKLLDAKA